MVASINLSEIKSGEEIFESTFDQEIDQSAIFEKINFTCINAVTPGIVLTPICDIITKRAPYIKIAQIVSAEFVCEAFLLSKKLSEEQIAGTAAISSRRQLDSIREEFIDHYIGNRTHRYHFLPKLDGVIDNSFIDFLMVQTMTPENLKNNKKIAVLKSPWRESVPSRYAAYCLRIGTPRFSEEFLQTTLSRICAIR
jgi:hypothetical protein